MTLHNIKLQYTDTQLTISSQYAHLKLIIKIDLIGIKILKYLTLKIDTPPI